MVLGILGTEKEKQFSASYTHPSSPQKFYPWAYTVQEKQKLQRAYFHTYTHTVQKYPQQIYSQ